MNPKNMELAANTITLPSHANIFTVVIAPFVAGRNLATRGAQEPDPEAGVDDVQARYRPRYQLGLPPLHHHFRHRAIPG